MTEEKTVVSSQRLFFEGTIRHVERCMYCMISRISTVRSEKEKKDLLHVLGDPR